MILGVVLAGGSSTRFGSDKALADLGGSTLLTRAVDGLAAWCERVVVVGREIAPAQTLPDWPRSGMGPLAGLAAALRLARDEGFEAVLSCGVDAAVLPADLYEVLAPGPSCLTDQPVIGLWPVAVTPALEALLRSEERHSFYRLCEIVGARRVETSRPVPNINTRADLAALQGKVTPD